MPMDLREQKFGIEIELTGLTRKRAAEVIGKYLGQEPHYDGGYYEEYSVRDGQGRKWKVMYDSSIVAVKKGGGSAGDEYKVEFVSPICEYADIPTIQELVRQLRHAGAIAGENAGIHVHVNAAPYTARTLRNITTAAMIAKAAIAVGTNKKVWTGIASVIAALCLPFILIIVCILSIASGGADHNRSAVRLAFEGGTIPSGMPADYREYIGQMQESFGELDTVLGEIDNMTEGELTDRYLVKAVFYSLYFGADRVRLEASDYQRFAECFVNYEERTKTIENPDGSESEETYVVAVAVTDKVELFEKISTDYGTSLTYEQQSNAVNVWYLAKYNTTAPQEGDAFEDWSGWSVSGEVTYYDLPASEVGGKVVELAMSRLGHPYSQTYRGKGNYTDCSYLTMWCYRHAGITIPGTAAEQGRYMVEHDLTIAKEDLQPGDLVFWSHKPNGRFMNITHVGVYVGNGMVVDASYSKGKVVHRNLFDSDKQVLYGRPQ